MCNIQFMKQIQLANLNKHIQCLYIYLNRHIQCVQLCSCLKIAHKRSYEKNVILYVLSSCPKFVHKRSCEKNVILYVYLFMPQN